MSWRAICVVLGAVIACGNIAGPPGSTAPMNSCSGTCAGDAGAAPVCTPPGVCLASAGISNAWTAVVTLSQDATAYATASGGLAPGVTFALPLGQLVAAPLPSNPPPTCQTESCAALPQVVQLQGTVGVSPQAAVLARWYLGNTGQTTMPVQATFWPQWSAGASTVDAVSVELPLEPIALSNIPVASGVGPGGGPALSFSAGALPPLLYQTVLQPIPPFDEAYPPEVRLVDLTMAGGRSFEENVSWVGDFDTTIVQGGTGFPTFDFSRADLGSLEGWTAWLRDQKTLRRISNLARLHGTGMLGDPGVQLLTRHNAGDALTNAQLVLTPDAASNLPTWIFTPLGAELSRKESYPGLPPPVTASGSVGVPADIVFEATGMCRFESNGTLVLDAPLTSPDYSFSRHVTTTTGDYSVQLPLGQYEVTVVPNDSTSALYFQKGFDLSNGQCQPMPTPLIKVAKRHTITGKASVADGRPLAGATVDVVPTDCAVLAAGPTCLPRSAQTITAADGSYSLSLDSGAYLLRVKPAEGTRFPWVVQPLSVDPSNTPAPPTVVPAPVYVGLELVDPAGNNVVQAVVRVYQTPATGGPPFEIGAAITDGNGHFDMYLAPSAQ